MRILIACEFSGRVRDAFLAAGHDAVSIDLLPSESATGPHIIGDVRPYLDAGWDAMIAHPPCTYLANSGAGRLYRNGAPYLPRWAALDDGAAFVRELWRAPIPRVAIENPVMLGYARDRIGFGRPTQTIQPYEFGHPESKRTCLWLRGLPKLHPTNILPLPESGRWDNQTASGQNRLTPSPDRWKLRSVTYHGIAAAMGNQWGTYLHTAHREGGQ